MSQQTFYPNDVKIILTPFTSRVFLGAFTAHVEPCGDAMTISKLLVCAAFFAALAPALSVQAEDFQSGESHAVLIGKAPSPMEAVIDGRIWRCDAANCVALANDSASSQSIGRECHRAAVWLGQFSAYQTGKRSLTDAELSECNARVTTKTPRSPD